MIDRKQLIDLVKKEAQALIVHATKEERGRLDFENLRPANSRNCIYGKMTGDCFSDRAMYLVKKCAPKLIHGGGADAPDKIVSNRSRRVKNPLENYYWSPIEVFTINKIYPEGLEPQATALIAFLREETSTLDIS